MGKSLIIKNADFSAVAVYTEIQEDFPYIPDVANLPERTYSLNGANWGVKTYNKHIFIQVPQGAKSVRITPQSTPYGITSTKYYGNYGFFNSYPVIQGPTGGSEIDYATGSSMTSIKSADVIELNLPEDCHFIVFSSIVYRNDAAYNNNEPYIYRPVGVEINNYTV